MTANMLHYITAGERLWNGVIVTAPLAARIRAS